MRALTFNSPRLLLRAAIVLLAVVPFLATGFAPRPEPEPPGPNVAMGSRSEGVSTSEIVSTSEPVERPEMVRLAPGSRYRSDEPPAGWSHVLFQSTPVLSSGALDTLSREAHATARRIRLAIFADVTDAAPHRLRRVGVGLSAPVVGRGPEAGDVVVAATNVGESSGEWSTKERIILAAGSRELGRASLAASTPTFALIRTPTTFLVGGSHATVDVLYAVLVDPASGRIRFFAGRATADGTPPVVRELKTPAIVDGPLHVKAKTFAGIPVSWSFAMADVPDGDERPIPDELAAFLTPTRLETADARSPSIEAAFRDYAGRPTLAPTARVGVPAQGD